MGIVATTTRSLSPTIATTFFIFFFFSECPCPEKRTGELLKAFHEAISTGDTKTMQGSFLLRERKGIIVGGVVRDAAGRSGGGHDVVFINFVVRASQDCPQRCSIAPDQLGAIKT